MAPARAHAGVSRPDQPRAHPPRRVKRLAAQRELLDAAAAGVLAVGANRRITDPLPLPETVPDMKKIKVLATTAALTAPILLPTVAQAKATWT